jgi:hypothetical protein
MIPAYSAFVARGDVVHAGDAHDGTDIRLRYHAHCRSNYDTVLNNVKPSYSSSVFFLRLLVSLNFALLCYI